MNNLNYGVIGNCRSAALISQTGCIEWCCLPDPDSSSFFAKILDRKKGGEFDIQVPHDFRIEQHYIPRTNILVTRYSRKKTKFEVIDFMPRYKNELGQVHCPPDIIRYIKPISGKPVIRVKYQPKPCYAQYQIKTEVRKEYIKTGTVNGSYESIYLYSNLDLAKIDAGEPVPISSDSYFLVSYNQKLLDLDIDWIHLEYQKTRVYWLDWSAKTPRFQHYKHEINRSALVLKMLSFQNSGAISAALTTSIPEIIGGQRNWDYRFCWMRDASMTISILTRLNHYNVARRFMSYILSIIPYKDEKIQIMYGLKGQKKLTEKILTSLSGYENSRPVRIGNAAYTQKQNDIFGVLLDVIYQYLMIYKKGIADYQEELWTVVRSLAKHVEDNWARRDTSIWEFRTLRKHFTFSKILSWVAIDRALKIATYFEMDRYIEVWSDIREKIKTDIMTKGWNPEINAFTQVYGEPHLDASNLMMEHYGFISADDPKYISTVLLTREHLCQDGLMFRYLNEDDFGKPQTSFMVCTFWLIKSLYKIGEKQTAKNMFDRILQYSNHLGLYSEDIDIKTKRLLGNFPQGYSHLALIDTALTLMDD
ncbi:MAG: glycoside hydrolase family 15 protein [Sedimentisphaerales bacterium]|nr:glycoside hydrolase family 15 protein [Sedimentisphaerales bacterium]